MVKIDKLQPGDVLLLPTYYYSEPYKALKNQIEFKAELFLEGMINYMKKILGETIQNAILSLVPPTAEFVSSAVAKQVVRLAQQEYIHAELYLGKGWVLAAWLSGVKLLKYPPSHYQMVDVLRFEGVDAERMLKAVDKYWNLPYDYASLGLNSIAEIVGAFGKFVGYEDLEEKVQDLLAYNNPKNMICSELVQRMLHEGGIEFDQPFEFISPQDLKEHPKAKLI